MKKKKPFKEWLELVVEIALKLIPFFKKKKK